MREPMTWQETKPALPLKYSKKKKGFALNEMEMFTVHMLLKNWNIHKQKTTFDLLKLKKDAEPCRFAALISNISQCLFRRCTISNNIIDSYHKLNIKGWNKSPDPAMLTRDSGARIHPFFLQALKTLIDNNKISIFSIDYSN